MKIVYVSKEYEAHIAACEKYSKQIAFIKKNKPNWQPKFQPHDRNKQQ